MSGKGDPLSYRLFSAVLENIFREGIENRQNKDIKLKTLDLQSIIVKFIIKYEIKIEELLKYTEDCIYLDQ